MTPKMMEALKSLVTAGSLTITVDRFAARRVHPGIARRLMAAGYATYGPGGAGNGNFLVPTDAGRAACQPGKPLIEIL